MRSPLMAALVLSLASSAHAQSKLRVPDDFIGTWQGAIYGANRMGLVISRDSAGRVQGQMTSIDQGGVTLGAVVQMRAESLVVLVPAARARYVGVLSEAGDSLRGRFAITSSMRLDFGRVSALTVVRRPQEPLPPFPYRTEDVSFVSAPGVRLAGTLTVPEGEGPFPAVVMATISGPHDRDQTVFGHKPFLVLADHLARQGIAALRVDDRGTGKSTGKFMSATTADFAADAEAGVRFLVSHPAIARDRVGILGHDEGGLVGELVASRSSDVAFLIMLGTPGVRGDSLILLQTRAMLETAGLDSARIALTLRFDRRIHKLARQPMDSAKRVAQMQVASQQFYEALPLSARSEDVSRFLVVLTMRASTPWYRFMIMHDPAPVLQRVKVPVLAVIGTLDMQVPYAENLAAIEAALKTGGNTDFQTVALPHRNHLFQSALNGSVTEYMQIQETLSPGLLDLVSEWINQRFAKR